MQPTGKGYVDALGDELRRGPCALVIAICPAGVTRVVPAPPGIRRTGSRSGPALPNREGAAPGLRRSVRTVPSQSLVVSAVATNAMIHAGTDMSVTVSEHRQAIRIAVREQGSDLPVEQPVASDEHGEGWPSSTACQLVGVLSKTGAARSSGR